MVNSLLRPSSFLPPCSSSSSSSSTSLSTDKRAVVAAEMRGASEWGHSALCKKAAASKPHAAAAAAKAKPLQSQRRIGSGIGIGIGSGSGIGSGIGIGIGSGIGIGIGTGTGIGIGIGTGSGIGIGTGIRMGPAPGAGAGEIRRLVLSKEGRTKLNTRADRDFYSHPRLVKHMDDAFLAQLTQLYRERIKEGGEVLDLMSSWASHLPADAGYKHVVGHGMNAGELARNARLERFVVRDLNADEGWRWMGEEEEAGSFDAVLCAAGVQYLEEPERVFALVWRLLRPGGVCVVSFSGARMFYEKAVAAWRDGTAYSRVRLVEQYFQCVSGFTQPEVIRGRPAAANGGGGGDDNAISSLLRRLLARLLQPPNISDPFYAVVAYKSFKPVFILQEEQLP